MRPCHRLGCLLVSSILPAAAQISTRSACSPTQLRDAVKAVDGTRQQLQNYAVREADPLVPSTIGTQLVQLKDHLTLAARATFSCAAPDASPEQLQTQLSESLHANLGTAAESLVETRDGKERGVYGSDLSVQIFELFGKPRIFEVDFRYGIPCGDDHLLLVFEAGTASAPDTWHERLRWDAGQYMEVGKAIGDFVLLAPLTGNDKSPRWRYLVAHGHPGCGNTPRASEFDLDLLTPTVDPAHPSVDWHFEHEYTQGDMIPRLATTEDTIDFRLAPAPADEAQMKSAHEPVKAPEVFRFHLNSSGRVEPSPSSPEAEGSDATASHGSSTKN